MTALHACMYFICSLKSQKKKLIFISQTQGGFYYSPSRIIKYLLLKARLFTHINMSTAVGCESFLLKRLHAYEKPQHALLHFTPIQKTRTDDFLDSQKK